MAAHQSLNRHLDSYATYYINLTRQQSPLYYMQQRREQTHISQVEQEGPYQHPVYSEV